jgi:ATP-dependent DNA helicase RecQ
LIILNLGMTNPVVISVSPDKPNIKYHATVKTTVINAFQELLQKLKDHGRTVPRVVIFARTYEHCTMLYRFFKHGLGKDFTFPRGSPDVSKHRLVDMFTNVTEGTVKESIISSMCNDGEILRVLICTVAFGMGLNTEGVREVIHWGISSDIESYIQETGRGGRDGLPCKAVLYYKNSELRLTTTSQCMIDYCKNVTVCRRKILFKNFDCASVSSVCNGCVCCDICSFQCVCQKCNFCVC